MMCITGLKPKERNRILVRLAKEVLKYNRERAKEPRENK